MTQAVNRILRFDCFGFDVETYNSNKGIPAFNPWTGAKIRVASFGLPTGETFVFDHYHVDPQYLQWIFPNRALCVGQNLKFDFQFLQYWFDIWDFGPIWDTMIAEQLTTEGRVTNKEFVPVGLDAIANRRLDVTLPKEGQHYDWSRNELAEWTIEYAARDALIVLPIYELQREHLREQGQLRVAQLEFDAVPATGAIELNGIRLDPVKWQAAYEIKRKEIEPIEDELWDRLSINQSLFKGVSTLNLNASGQIQKAFEDRNIPVPFDNDGKPTVEAKRIKQYVEKYPIIGTYMKYKALAKSLQSYGPNWIEMISHFDGRIHGQLKQIGTETGRWSANKPNLTQIPTDDLYRNCFIPNLGNVFIATDLNQAELRILAELCRDPRLLYAYDNDIDLHKITASVLFNVLLENVLKDQRAFGKIINFGTVYGIGATSVAERSGMPLNDAKAMLHKFLREAYPVLGGWLDDRAGETLRTHMARTMLGRVRRYYGDYTDDAVAAAIARNGKNLPIQGTCSDIAKRMVKLIYDGIKGHRKHIKQVLIVHDESLLESSPEYADEATYIQETAMLQAESEFFERVPPKVDTNRTLLYSKEPSEAQKQAAERRIKLSKLAWV